MSFSRILISIVTWLIALSKAHNFRRDNNEVAHKLYYCYRLIKYIQDLLFLELMLK